MTANNHTRYLSVFSSIWGQKNGCKWINIFNADMASVYFPDKIIGFLIVEKYLKKLFTKNDAEIEELIGFKTKNVIDSYTLNC